MPSMTFDTRCRSVVSTRRFTRCTLAGDGECGASPGPRSDTGSDSEGDDAAPAAWLALSDGRFSPPPLSATLVHGQEVVHEREDREQVRFLFLHMQRACGFCSFTCRGA